MKKINALTTGFSRGYVKVENRFNEKEINIDQSLKMNKNSNQYRCVKNLVKQGATRVTMAANQHSSGSQYLYFIYTGYAD